MSLYAHTDIQTYRVCPDILQSFEDGSRSACEALAAKGVRPPDATEPGKERGGSLPVWGFMVCPHNKSPTKFGETPTSGLGIWEFPKIRGPCT